MTKTHSVHGYHFIQLLTETHIMDGYHSIQLLTDTAIFSLLSITIPRLAPPPLMYFWQIKPVGTEQFLSFRRPLGRISTQSSLPFQLLGSLAQLLLSDIVYRWESSELACSRRDRYSHTLSLSLSLSLSPFRPPSLPPPLKRNRLVSLIRRSNKIIKK